MALGFDFEHGRLDESLHPFCGGVPDDIRMTARYDETDAATGLMAVLHETGHALYNAGLPKAGATSRSAGRARSRCTRASRSWSRCRSAVRACSLLIWRPCSPRASGWRPGVRGRQPVPQAIRVERGLIRVDADEVTYPLHVVLRYRLEKALVTGELEVADLPAAWNEACARCSACCRRTIAAGVLQDIHWPSGAIGYFPCYTLGAILAAQPYEAMIAAVPISSRTSPRAISAAARLAAPTSTSRARYETCVIRAPPAARSSCSRPAPPRDALSCPLIGIVHERGSRSASDASMPRPHWLRPARPLDRAMPAGRRPSR